MFFVLRSSCFTDTYPFFIASLIWSFITVKFHSSISVLRSCLILKLAIYFLYKNWNCFKSSLWIYSSFNISLSDFIWDCNDTQQAYSVAKAFLRSVIVFEYSFIVSFFMNNSLYAWSIAYRHSICLFFTSTLSAMISPIYLRYSLFYIYRIIRSSLSYINFFLWSYRTSTAYSFS